MRDAIDALRIPDNSDAKAQLREKYAELFREAFRSRTIQDMVKCQTRAMAAAHEAGHAVVHAAYGDPLKFVKVWRTRTQWGDIWEGLTQPEAKEEYFLTPSMGELPYLFRARSTIAGVIGEALNGHNVVGSSIDEVVVSQSFSQQLALIRMGFSETNLYIHTNSTLEFREKLLAVINQIMVADIIGGTTAIIRANKEQHNKLVSALLAEKRIDGNRLKLHLRDIVTIKELDAQA